MMKSLIQAFPAHLREAVSIGSAASLPAASSPIDRVLITGLGGSGIGGTIAAQLLESTASVPILTNKNYGLPAYVNERTLVIVSS